MHTCTLFPWLYTNLLWFIIEQRISIKLCRWRCNRAYIWILWNEKRSSVCCTLIRVKNANTKNRRYHTICLSLMIVMCIAKKLLIHSDKCRSTSLKSQSACNGSSRNGTKTMIVVAVTVTVARKWDGKKSNSNYNMNHSHLIIKWQNSAHFIYSHNGWPEFRLWTQEIVIWMAQTWIMQLWKMKWN